MLLTMTGNSGMEMKICSALHWKKRLPFNLLSLFSHERPPASEVTEFPWHCEHCHYVITIYRLCAARLSQVILLEHIWAATGLWLQKLWGTPQNWSGETGILLLRIIGWERKCNNWKTLKFTSHVELCLVHIMKTEQSWEHRHVRISYLNIYIYFCVNGFHFQKADLIKAKCTSVLPLQ